jgi:hypothetical protein
VSNFRYPQIDDINVIVDKLLMHASLQDYDRSTWCRKLYDKFRNKRRHFPSSLKIGRQTLKRGAGLGSSSGRSIGIPIVEDSLSVDEHEKQISRELQKQTPDFEFLLRRVKVILPSIMFWIKTEHPLFRDIVGRHAIFKIPTVLESLLEQITGKFVLIM